MKKITLLLLFLLTSWHINAQIGIVEGLNSTTLPTGWTQTNFYSTTTTPCEGTHAWRDNFYSFSPTGSLTTRNYPAVSNATNVNVSFQWQATEWSVDSGVGFTVNAEFSIDNGVTWQAVASPFSASSISSCDLFTAVIPAASVPMGSDFKFRVSGVWDSGDCYFWIDNISITQTAFNPPACTTLSSPLNGAVDVSSTIISWASAAGIPTGYKLNVGTTPGGTNVLNMFDVGNVVTYNLGVLTPATTYFVTVIPYNTNGDAAGPCTESSFTTCGPVTTLPWTENFDGLSTVGITSFPGCWTKENGDWSTAVAGTYNTPRSGANYLRDAWNATDEYMWTKGFNLVAGTSYDFSAFVQGDGGSTWVVDMFYNTSPISTGATQLGLGYNVPGTGTYAIQPYVEMRRTFVPSSSGIYYFAVRVNEPTSAPWYVAFDDFRLETTPTCAAPLNLAAANITTSSAVLSWTESGSATVWNLQYGVAGFVLGSGTIVNDVTNPYILSALTPSTTYQFYVQANCGASSLSAWSGPYTFSTLCASVTSFSENFDGVATTTFPICWGKVGSAGSAYLQTTTPNSAPNTLYMYGFGVMPVVKTIPVSNLGAGTHRLKFNMRANYTVDGVIEIGYLTNPSDADSFVVLGSQTAASLTYAQYTFAPPAGSYSDNLAIRHTGTPGNSVLIDDMVWEPVPSAAPGCASNIVATPNATCGNFNTTITWNATPNADGYRLTVGTTTGGTDVMNDVNIGSVTTYSVAGNVNTTYFYTLVPFNGIGSATGCTENTFTTVATGCYCASVPTSNDDLGITNLLLGTTNFPNGDVTYSDYSATPVTFNQDGTVNVQITFATGYTYDTNIWIDFNDNYIFESSELVNSVIGTDNTNPTTTDASFVMPMSAALGQHRMRVGTADSGQLVPNPCYSGSYGVTLDFTVNIQPVLSTSSFDSATFTAYPNPVKDMLNLSYSKTISNVTVFNLLGQQVLVKTVNDTQSQIDMSTLAKGAYMVKVTSDNQVKTIKVIKE